MPICAAIKPLNAEPKVPDAMATSCCAKVRFVALDRGLLPQSTNFHETTNQTPAIATLAITDFNFPA
jgi:hypothetical protein